MDAVVTKQSSNRIHSARLAHLIIGFDSFDPFHLQRSSVMRNLRNAILKSRIGFGFLMLVAVICTFAATAPRSSVAAPSVSITVVNNSERAIRYLYLSPANNDNWGADQLDGSSISSGATRTLSVSWDQATVKLVAEDQEGCFMSTTVDASGSPTWTIDGNTTRNCGN
jgi:hypothetical protein